MTDAPASLLGFTYEGAIDVPTPDKIGAVKNVQFTTTLSKDCTQEELNSLLDKCRLAVTRQRVFAEIDRKAIDFLNHSANIEFAHRMLAEEDKNFAARADQHDGRAGRGLSSSEQKARQEKLANLANLVASKDATEKMLKSLRSMVNPEALVKDEDRNAKATQIITNEQGRWADNGGASLS